MREKVSEMKRAVWGLLLASVVMLSACSVLGGSEPLPMQSALSSDDGAQATALLGPTSNVTLASDIPTNTPSPAPPSATTATVTPTPLIEPTSTVSPASLTLTAEAVVANALQIEYFNATPTTVNPGGTVTLVWSTNGANQATLFRLNADGSFAEALQVDTEGARTLAASTSNGTETFVLRIGDGSNVLDDSVSISIFCGRTWFFTVSAPQTCPASAPANSPAAEETFERGWMYWIEVSDTIYAVYNDGGRPAWQAFEDTWLLGEPESDASIVPPSSNLFQPSRGIGKVWRNNSTVRDRLGWATEPEQGLGTTFQQEASSEPGVYFIKRDGQLVGLASGGGDWDFISLPSP